MQTEAMLLLFQYTIPALGKCSDATDEEIDAYADQVSMGKIPEGSIENRSKFAALQISKIAKEKGKTEPDSDDVREYFWFRHNKLLDEFSGGKKDPANEFCKIYVGTVVRVMEHTAFVTFCLGERECKTTFVKEIKTGDTVVMHRNFITEKIDNETAIKIDGSWNTNRTKVRHV